jgi:hypothetical protein
VSQAVQNNALQNKGLKIAPSSVSHRGAQLDHPQRTSGP